MPLISTTARIAILALALTPALCMTGCSPSTPAQPTGVTQGPGSNAEQPQPSAQELQKTLDKNSEGPITNPNAPGAAGK